MGMLQLLLLQFHLFLLRFPCVLMARVFTQFLEGKSLPAYQCCYIHPLHCLDAVKKRGSTQNLPRRSWIWKSALLILPQPRCFPRSECCGFKAIVPDPHHTRIFVFSLHSQCQAVTSTIVSGTRWSLRWRKKGAKGGGDSRGRAQIPLCSRRMSHFLAPALRCFIYCRSADMKPSSLVPHNLPGLGLPADCPINHTRRLGSAHRAAVLPASGL